MSDDFIDADPVTREPMPAPRSDGREPTHGETPAVHPAATDADRLRGPAMLAEEDGEALIERAAEGARAPEPGTDPEGPAPDRRSESVDANSGDNAAEWSRTRE